MNRAHARDGGTGPWDRVPEAVRSSLPALVAASAVLVGIALLRPSVPAAAGASPSEPVTSQPGKDQPEAAGSGLFAILQGSILSSIPALSALTFLIVSVKVFRASGMEGTTTVAIVSTADTVALLKGVILTLLPGFLTAVTATALWWWAEALPAGVVGDDRGVAARALFAPQAGFAWALVVMSFFTVSWPIFLLLFLPAGYVTIVLLRRSRSDDHHDVTVVRLRRWLKGIGGTAAVLAIGFLTLAPSVWLPLRTISIVPGHTVTANAKPLPRQFAAYLLSSDKDGASLLLAKPRAVVQVGTGDIEALQPLCVTPEASTRIFYLRLSQLVGIDADHHSPYPHCPELNAQSIFGTDS